MRRISTREWVLAALFTALTAVGAFVKIPVPVVPFTLQFLFTMLAGLLLGGPLGAISVGGYAALGLLGLPIFAQGGGIGYVLNPSFGYILGFCAAAYATGRIAERAPGRILAANFLGLAIVYLVGMAYYYLISHLYLGNPIGLWTLFLYGFLLAVPGDIALCVLAAALARRLIPVVRRGARA